MADRAVYEKREYEEALKSSEEAILALEKHYKLELNETTNNLIKLKEVQELNDLRAGELKHLLDDEQKIRQELSAETELLRIKNAELLEEKKELFKIIEERKAKEEESLKIYKDKINEAENQAIITQEKTAQLEI